MKTRRKTLSGCEENDLEEITEACAKRWSLTDLVPLGRTPMGLVLRVTMADGSFAVLKCLSEIGLRNEGTTPAVLRAFSGVGAVQLIEAGRQAQLIEYCEGPSLLDWIDGADDRVAVPIIADTVSRLHATRSSRPEGVPTLADRCLALNRMLPSVDGPLRKRFARARAIADDLLASQSPALLHGDIHHENIMRARRPEGWAWLAIDPQGVWGDPAYDVANAFGNPLGREEVTLAAGRPKRLASAFAGKLGFDPNRVLGWAFVHCCVSAAWSIEDGEDPSFRMKVADEIANAL